MIYTFLFVFISLKKLNLYSNQKHMHYFAIRIWMKSRSSCSVREIYFLWQYFSNRFSKLESKSKPKTQSKTWQSFNNIFVYKINIQVIWILCSTPDRESPFLRRSTETMNRVIWGQLHRDSGASRLEMVSVVVNTRLFKPFTHCSIGGTTNTRTPWPQLTPIGLTRNFIKKLGT